MTEVLLPSSSDSLFSSSSSSSSSSSFLPIPSSSTSSSSLFNKKDNVVQSNTKQQQSQLQSQKQSQIKTTTITTEKPSLKEQRDNAKKEATKKREQYAQQLSLLKTQLKERVLSRFGASELLLPETLLISLRDQKYLLLDDLADALQFYREQWISKISTLDLTTTTFKLKGKEGKKEEQEIVYIGQLNQEGQPEGFGKAFYPKDGGLAYVGEWKNGQRHGEGVSYLHGGYLRYQGQWKEGKRNGFGVTFAPNHLVSIPLHFVSWKDNKAFGFGFLYSTLYDEPLSQGEWGVTSTSTTGKKPKIQQIKERHLRRYKPIIPIDY